MVQVHQGLGYESSVKEQLAADNSCTVHFRNLCLGKAFYHRNDQKQLSDLAWYCQQKCLTAETVLRELCFQPLSSDRNWKASQV